MGQDFAVHIDAFLPARLELKIPFSISSLFLFSHTHLRHWLLLVDVVLCSYFVAIAKIGPKSTSWRMYVRAKAIEDAIQNRRVSTNSPFCFDDATLAFWTWSWSKGSDCKRQEVGEWGDGDWWSDGLINHSEPVSRAAFLRSSLLLPTVNHQETRVDSYKPLLVLLLFIL